MIRIYHYESSKPLFESASAGDIYEAMTEALSDKVDLRGADLRGLDTSGHDFVTISNADLSRAIFKGATFHDTTFEYCELEGAVFADAHFKSVYLIGCLAAGARFDRATLLHLTARKTDLDKAVFKDARLDMHQFEVVSAKGADFTNARLDTHGLFDRCFLNRANFDDARIGSTRLQETNIGRARFRRANLNDTYFERCPAKGTDFWEAHMGNALMRAMDLTSSVLPDGFHPEELHLNESSRFPANTPEPAPQLGDGMNWG